MTAGQQGAGSRRWLVWGFVGAGVLLFAGANAHLIYVAVVSQPDCVAHSKAPGQQHDYRAAKSAC